MFEWKLEHRLNSDQNFPASRDYYETGCVPPKLGKVFYGLSGVKHRCLNDAEVEVVWCKTWLSIALYLTDIALVASECNKASSQ